MKSFWQMAKKEDGLTYWITDSLGVGPAPMSYARLDELKEMGVGAILNLCAEFPDLPDIQRSHDFDVFYLPIVDEGAPEPEELDKALAWLDEVLYLGKKAYIHCRHGIGRTGTVLNAYLLRRGLGHKLAAKTLKKLRSRPESFDQWWFLRKYGRKTGKLTVREPSLESKRQVDLAPFFQDYGDLVLKTESALKGGRGEPDRCGRDHTRCCRAIISVSLIEALFLASEMALDLTSEERSKVIGQAASFKRRGNDRDVSNDGTALQTNGFITPEAACPLLKDGACILFDNRPLTCRTFDMTAPVRTDIWGNVLTPGLEEISRQIYFAYFSRFPADDLPDFTLPEVISGRYVQIFFDWVIRTTQKKG